VRNIGEGNATGVVVQDVLPDDVTFVSADPTQGTYDPETGIWEVGDLASGAMAMMLIEVDVGGGGGDALKSALYSFGSWNRGDDDDDDDAHSGDDDDSSGDHDSGSDDDSSGDRDEPGLCIENCAELVSVDQMDINPDNDRDCVTVFTGGGDDDGSSDDGSSDDGSSDDGSSDDGSHSGDDDDDGSSDDGSHSGDDDDDDDHRYTVAGDDDDDHSGGGDPICPVGDDDDSSSDDSSSGDDCVDLPDWWSRYTGRTTRLLGRAAVAEAGKAQRLARRANRMVRRLSRKVAGAERKGMITSSCLPKVWGSVEAMKQEAQQMGAQ
jgi:hypothetical protein